MSTPTPALPDQAPVQVPGHAARRRTGADAAARRGVRQPLRGGVLGSAAGRRGIARQFALFLRWKGIDAWVLPEREQPRQPGSFAPRIITAEEMAPVIACADARPASRWPANPAGLRHARPLAVVLRTADQRGTVPPGRRRQPGRGRHHRRKAKHNRTRLVPMSPSLTAHARRYSAAAGLVPEDPAAWFFPSPRGGAYHPGSATAHIQDPDAQGQHHHGLRARSSRP